MSITSYDGSSIDELAPPPYQQSETKSAMFVLAGGYGARLRPFTQILPKVLLPIEGEPLFDRIVRQGVDAGCVRLYFLLGEHANVISAYAKANGYLDRDDIEIVLKGSTGDKGTAGPLFGIDEKADHWLVMNGDIWTDCQLSEVIEAHRRSCADLTVMTVTWRSIVPYGVIETEPDGSVACLLEKPQTEQKVTAGIYVLGPKARKLMSPIGDMPELIVGCKDLGMRVGTYEFNGAWHDIGTPETYLQALCSVGLADQ
jgi:NDP-sugar pyrophosphorylase family protein